MKKIWVFLLSTLCVCAAHSASFDCKKAATSVEKSICASARLSLLDEALAENYKHFMASGIGDSARAELKSSQKRWLGLRGKCKDESCLAAAYEERIEEICSTPMVSGIHPGCVGPQDMQ